MPTIWHRHNCGCTAPHVSQRACCLRQVRGDDVCTHASQYTMTSTHPTHSVSHRAPRDATSGQDMVDEHYNFAVQGTLGRMPWPANQTLAADVMLKGKARCV